MDVLLIAFFAVVTAVAFYTAVTYGVFGLLLLLLAGATLYWATVFCFTYKQVKKEGSETPILEAFLRTVVAIGG